MTPRLRPVRSFLSDRIGGPIASLLLAGLLVLPVPLAAGETDLQIGAGFGPLRRPPRQAFATLEVDRWVTAGRNFGFWASLDRGAKATWAGAGLIAGLDLGRGWEVAVSSGPGWYPEEGRLDLGSHLEFRSTARVMRHLGNGWMVGLGASHISNGGIARHNPGAEVLRVVLEIPLDRYNRPGP